MGKQTYINNSYIFLVLPYYFWKKSFCIVPALCGSNIPEQQPSNFNKNTLKIKILHLSEISLQV